MPLDCLRKETLGTRGRIGEPPNIFHFLLLLLSASVGDTRLQVWAAERARGTQETGRGYAPADPSQLYGFGQAMPLVGPCFLLLKCGGPDRTHLMGLGESPKRENAIQRILACTHSMLSLIPMTTLGSRHREVKGLAPGDTAIQSRASVPAQAIWLQILLVPTPFRGAFPAQALWELDQYCLPSPFLSRMPGRGCPGGRLRPARLQEREGAKMLWEAASRLGFNGAKAMPPRGSSRCPGLSEADLPGSFSK